MSEEMHPRNRRKKLEAELGKTLAQKDGLEEHAPELKSDVLDTQDLGDTDKTPKKKSKKASGENKGEDVQ